MDASHVAMCRMYVWRMGNFHHGMCRMVKCHRDTCRSAICRVGRVAMCRMDMRAAIGGMVLAQAGKKAHRNLPSPPRRHMYGHVIALRIRASTIGPVEHPRPQTRRATP